MAKKKKGRRRQGLVSWATSIVALIIGFSGAANLVKRAGIAGLADAASFGLAPPTSRFNLNLGLELYAPMIGGIVFKKLMANLARTAKVQSLLPSF